MPFGEKLRNALEGLRRATVIDKDSIKAAVKEIQRALISSDVEIALVLELSKKIENSAFEELPSGLTRREHVIKITYDSLVELLGGENSVPENPRKILLVGLFGSGKTTTTGKLGKFFSKRGKNVGVIAADTFRPAAFEQLKQICEKAKLDFFGMNDEKNASKVVKEGLQKFKGKDLIIVDSAGRNALDEALVKEIKEIDNELQPDQTWLVLGADIGQIAKKQAQAFHEAIGVNGVILTRTDGSAKGGGTLAACHETKAPVYFIGIGEKIDDLEKFEANRFLSKLMGYGDLEALLEKVQEISEEEELSPEQLLQEEFNFKTFYAQLKAARKMGPLGKVAEMLGFSMKIPKEQLEVGDEKLKKFGHIIDSMAEKERIQPELLNKNRIQRIAKGSGTKEEEVRELIKQFKQMEKMFSSFKKIKSEKEMEQLSSGKGMEKLMKKMGMKQKKKKFRIR